MSHSPSLLFPWIFFAALDWFKQSFVLLHSQREVLTWPVTVHRYLKFIFDQLFHRASVLHLFLESDHLIVIREKILSTKAFEPGTLRTNETILNMVIKLASLGFGKLPSTAHCWILWYPVCLSVFPPSNHKPLHRVGPYWLSLSFWGQPPPAPGQWRRAPHRCLDLILTSGADRDGRLASRS